MIRIYTINGFHDIPDNILALLGQVVIENKLKYQGDEITEIDPTEATPVLEDVPEDPEVTIERLNARILELEAELEERRRSTDAVLEALRPLGTILQVEQASEVVQTVAGAPSDVPGPVETMPAGGVLDVHPDGSRSLHYFEPQRACIQNAPTRGVDGNSYTAAQAGASRYLRGL